MNEQITINRRKKSLRLRWIKAGPTFFVDVDNIVRKGVSLQAQITGGVAIIRYKGRYLRHKANRTFSSDHAGKLWANRKLKQLLKIRR